MNEIERLKQELDYHDNLYYNQDSPELTDPEYDILKQEYLNLTGQEEYNYVPGEAQFNKYPHVFQLKSLLKVKEDKLEKELKRLAPGIIELKYDGLTLADYIDGAIVTRGTDGLIGEDVKDTATKILKLPKLPWKENLPVRLEAFITKKAFIELNEDRIEEGLDPYENARSAVAGILRNKDISKVKGITYRAYNIVGSKLSEQEQLKILKELGFKVDDYFSYDENNINEAIEYIKNINRSKLEFDIDGMVIKSNKPNALEYFGETEHHPKSAVAFKWEEEGVWTKLNDIIYQVGRTGKVTPVGKIEPVKLAGSTITRVTLHNINWARIKNIKINGNVFVIKAHEVIPAILKCEGGIETILQEPEYCPSCGSKLEKKVNQLYCTNVICEGKLLYRTTHMVSKRALDINGLSEQTIQKMIDVGYLNDPWDIFDLNIEQIYELDGFAQKSTDKIYDAIQNARTNDFNKVIYASGIPLIGKKASKDIAKKYKSWTKLAVAIAFGENNLRKELITIDGIGEESINSFINNVKLLIRLADKMIEIKSIEDIINTNNIDSPFTNKKIYCTGTFAGYKKEELKKIIEDLGAEFTSGYAKSLDYLVVGSLKGSSKTEKAIKDGIKILQEAEFKQMIGG